MRIALIVSSLVLAGCTSVPQPVVDMAGVDQAKYSQDLAACYNEMPAVYFGNPVTACMKQKGYKVLVGF